MDPVSEVDALLRGHTLDARERLDDAVQGTRERIEAHIEAHPMRTILLAVGAGLLLGLLWGAARHRRSDGDSKP